MIITDYQTTVPFQFNPLKHHLSYIREFISSKINSGISIDKKLLIKEVKHIGASVMDVYTGTLTVKEICGEIKEYLENHRVDDFYSFSKWTGTNFSDFKTISLSDTSQWILKFHRNELKYVHIFPSRMSPHSFRVKANTLKSAILYYILIGKDFISSDDLNKARTLLGLSRIKSPEDAEAITEMIEILRN